MKIKHLLLILLSLTLFSCSEKQAQSDEIKALEAEIASQYDEEKAQKLQELKIAYTEAYPEDENTATFLVEISHRFWEQGNNDEALKFMSGFDPHKASPEVRPQALELYALIYTDKGEYNQAKQYLQQAMDEYPDYFEDDSEVNAWMAMLNGGGGQAAPPTPVVYTAEDELPDGTYYTLYPEEVSSSGFLTGSNEDYNPHNMIDHDPFTWWTPSPNRDGIGAWIQVNFKQTVPVSGFEIWAGSHNPDYPEYGNIFRLNNRVKRGTLHFSNGETISYQLNDIDDWQAVLFNDIETEYIRLTVEELYPGEKWNDLCISEFKVITTDPDNGIPEDMYEEGVAKPVIYFYPEKETDVTVTLDFKGKLHSTWPAYGDGWKVKASPDGTLTDAEGEIYSYLFWDGWYDYDWKMDEGFVVKGSETGEFLRNSLKEMGLKPAEYNEFIVYWLPLMEKNPYNHIYFAGEDYESFAGLNISPKPDELFRLFMVFRPLQAPVKVKPQALPQMKREGFHVLEWGGIELKREQI